MNAKLAVMAAVASLALFSPISRAEDAPDVNMKLIEKGAMPKLGGYRPQRITLSSEKPAGITKAPEVSAAVYGTLQFGGKGHFVILDEPAGQDAKIYVDANGNGDLTDDPQVTWTKHQYNQKFNQYIGEFQLPIGEGKTVSLGAYRFDKTDPQRQALKDNLFYYSDYALNGEITIGTEKYHAMMADDMATGDFHGNGIRLLIDRNHDGRFSGASEMFDASKPFNIGGTSYELADRTPDGSFKVKKSDQAVAEIQPPPDLSAGRQAIAFQATKMDGQAVSFPGDYKGKIVMLDFWATWCGPCMAEVPGLVKTYNQYHPQGFEILGVSLDQPKAEEKIKTTTGKMGMTWPQIYDGKFWKAEIAEKYGIEAIPAPFLIDGDTGKIIATGGDLRGEQLPKTIADALAKKAKK